MTAKPITVVGGGLAGLTLGIGLRRRNIPVTVWEAGHYPRHRVCGEFISGRGQAALARLGLLTGLYSAGAIDARTVGFFSPRAAAPIRELPEPAISVSRFVLDGWLAREFGALGGELREGERWRNGNSAEGVVRATGRRAQPTANGWRWFGLKVHARNVPLAADLEMHLSPSSYLGMSRLQNGEVNICGLFRRPAHSTEGPLDWRGALRGIPGTRRHERLRSAVFDDSSFCSVAGLSLEPRRAAASTDCCIGDSITMIPPVTGNGMSMAFESAELALEPLAAYSAGEMSWAAAQAAIAGRCDASFAPRLRWAAWLERLMFVSALQDVLVACLPRSQWLWRLLVNKTR
jgi:flavin-dependent dehydrogenase